MTPFLLQVARKYVETEAENLLDYCFVFPNKRSAVFFSHYLESELVSSEKQVVMPEITTIAALTATFSRLIPATRFEQLFILYNEYRKLSQDIPDFDKFLFWGEMLVSDFNDVDRYLVDPASLFTNVKRLKEINANYLTEEQLDIIRRYWGDEMEMYDPELFWTHMDANPSKLKEKFLKLWEILLPLYNGYQKELADAGLASEGMLLKNMLAKVKSTPADELPFRRYIFVGFNVLSAAEIHLFETLKARGMADFYWDFNSPAFELPRNKGARFMRRNIENFPSLYEVDSVKIKSMPQISITRVPSKVGMVKEAGEILGRWIKEKVVNTSFPQADTAVVLPEEDLFIPMIHSVPAEIHDLNVTMGFPLRFTPMASLLNVVTSMQVRSRLDGDRHLFMHDDVMDVLSHPLMQAICHDACNSLMVKIKKDRLFLVPADLLQADMPGSSSLIFSTVTDLNDPYQVFEYTRRIVGFLKAHSDSAGKAGKIERFFLDGFDDSLSELYEAIRRWGITMHESTFFHLLRRSISSSQVNFTGEPLKGLQMMGVLETRALDFENIIITSMNERVFPRKHFSRSFIPDNLRKAYGMSTVEFQESIYSYYFFRLISRAKRVELLYDGRTEGTNSGEMSRYLSQLIYFFPDAEISHKSKIFPAPTVAVDSISVTKTDEIIARLNQYKATEGEKKHLSASAINTYINCPLSFYLKYIEGLNLDDEVTDYMDSSTFGTILHEVMEHLYMDQRADDDSVIITSGILDNIIKSPSRIDRAVTESINFHYNHRGRDCFEPLKGESLLIGRVMVHFVKILLEMEKEFTPFEFIDAERVITTRYTTSDGIEVNIRQVIDRIDRINVDDPLGGLLRVVDYKTGEDKITFSNISELFDSENPNRRKAILQLMFYCNVLAAEEKYVGPIQPMIYLFKKLSTVGLKPISYQRKPLLDYRDINDEFRARFDAVIKEIFDPDVAFSQPNDDHACKFCNFRPVCGRNPK
ncbi:MAG: PD-(D/E)XK nuclease family protein [Lachnoclostridium sp.]|nr:PD-(D/E)XK nuclease family protein [Lachnoclostridium sp.]